MRWRLPHLALSKPLGNGNESKDSRNHNREENHADSAKFQPQVMGAVGHRTRVLTVLRVCLAATVERIGILRRQLQGLIKVQDRPVIAARVLLRQAPVVESIGRIGIQTQRLIEVLNGTAVISLLPVGVAAADESLAIPWIDPEGVIVILDGAAIVTLVRIRQAAVIERASKA